MSINKVLQIEPLLRRRFGIEMNNIAIVRVVKGLEGTPEHLTVAGGARNKVGEARRRREGGERNWAELGFDKNRGGGGGAVEREERSTVGRG